MIEILGEMCCISTTLHYIQYKSSSFDTKVLDMLLSFIGFHLFFLGSTNQISLYFHTSIDFYIYSIKKHYIFVFLVLKSIFYYNHGQKDIDFFCFRYKCLFTI